MKPIRYIRRALCIPCVLCAITACQGDWNDHYDRPTSATPQTLMQIIESDAQLSIFCEALQKTEMADALRSDQTYTVWAPNNEALANFDMSDQNALQRLVRNHVARFSNPTSSRERIRMINGKTMQYTDAATFNGASILQADIAAGNGLLHKLSSPIPYKYNIRELMDADSRFAVLSSFVAQFDTKEYDERHSTTYDSVFVDYNPLLEDFHYGIGDIGDEDSLFTMILPTNQAWQTEMARVSPSFTAYNTDAAVADSIRQVQTGMAILGGLTFRGIVDEQADSLLTVTGEVLHPVRDYLAGYERIEASNGIVYVATSQLNANDLCVWNHRLVTEAEEMDSRVAMSGTNCYIRTTDVNSLVQGVSEGSYLEVSSGNVDGGSTFYVANTLATKYDVYVDFVNPIVDGTNLAEEKTKVIFQLMYRGANGRSTAKNMNTPVEITGTETDGTPRPGIISVKAFEGVELPVSDFYDGMWHLQPAHVAQDVTPSTTLRVQTRVSAADARNGYVRKFRIDRIRFVPVTD